jgi:hypothetical protein
MESYGGRRYLGINQDGGQHETEEEDDEREEGAEAANGVEWRWVVNRWDTKEAHTKKHGAPNVPGLPEMKQAQGDENKGHEKGGKPMQARANGTEDMAAVQLTDREQVHGSHEQTDPGGTADGRKEKRAGVNAGVHEGVEKPHQQRHAKGDIGVIEICEARHEFHMNDSVEKSRDGENEAHKRARSANIKEGAVGANGGADQNESAERANERWKGKEVRIAGANVMMAAGEEVTEFMGKKNGEQREGEGEARKESGRMLVEKFVGVDKLIERRGLILGVGIGELSAGGEAGAKREQEQDAGEYESSGWRAWRNGKVLRPEEGLGAPVSLDRNRA